MKNLHTWKADLKRMKLDSIKAKAPGFFEVSGGYDMKVKPYSDSTANGLINAIIDFINFSGGNASLFKTKMEERKIKGKSIWMHASTRKEKADIQATFNGQDISIKVRIGNDHQSERLRTNTNDIQNGGGLYFVAKSMQPFLDWWQAVFFHVESMNNNKNRGENWRQMANV